MKKSIKSRKLSLQKLEISKLTKPSKILGGRPYASGYHGCFTYVDVGDANRQP